MDKKNKFFLISKNSFFLTKLEAKVTEAQNNSLVDIDDLEL